MMAEVSEAEDASTTLLLIMTLLRQLNTVCGETYGASFLMCLDCDELPSLMDGLGL